MSCGVACEDHAKTLSLTERQLGHWQEALAVVAEGWARMDLREAALERGVIIWHMHALNGEIEKVGLALGAFAL